LKNIIFLLTGGYIINKKGVFDKDVFLKIKPSFSSTLEFQLKMLFFLTFKNLSKNSEFCYKKTPFLH
jgi:hypothetical protein